MKAPGHTVRELTRWAAERGWSWRKTNGGHIAFRHASGGPIVFAPSTPGDRRSIANVRAKLRRSVAA